MQYLVLWVKYFLWFHVYCTGLFNTIARATGLDLVTWHEMWSGILELHVEEEEERKNSIASLENAVVNIDFIWRYTMHFIGLIFVFL